MGPLRGPSDTSPPFLLLLLFLGAFLRATSCGAAQPRVLFFSLFYFLFFFLISHSFPLLFASLLARRASPAPAPIVCGLPGGEGGSDPRPCARAAAGGGAHEHTPRNTQTHADLHKHTLIYTQTVPPAGPQPPSSLFSPLMCCWGGEKSTKPRASLMQLCILVCLGFAERVIRVFNQSPLFLFFFPHLWGSVGCWSRAGGRGWGAFLVGSPCCWKMCLRGAPLLLKPLRRFLGEDCESVLVSSPANCPSWLIHRPWPRYPHESWKGAGISGAEFC